MAPPTKSRTAKTKRSCSRSDSEKNKDGGQRATAGKDNVMGETEESDVFSEPVNCMICNEETSEMTAKLLQCERCMGWCCCSCIKVSDTEYDVFARSDTHWFCSDCTLPALQAVQNDKAIEDRCQEFLDKFDQRLLVVEKEVAKRVKFEDFKKLDGSVRALEEKMDKIVSSQEDVISKLGDKSQHVANVGVKEIEEREARKTNLILFGVKESVAADIEQRRTDDVRLFNNICTEVLGVSVDVKRVSRLGKRSQGTSQNQSQPERNSQLGERPHSNSRPMLVSLTSKEQVAEVLSLSKKLWECKQDEYRAISMKRDMTPLEREELRELVKQKKSETG